MSEDYDERWSEIWRDVSHELGSFLDDHNFSADARTFYQGTIMGVAGDILGVCLFYFTFLASTRSVWHICFYLNIYNFSYSFPLKIDFESNRYNDLIAI